MVRGMQTSENTETDKNRGKKKRERADFDEAQNHMYCSQGVHSLYISLPCLEKLFLCAARNTKIMMMKQYAQYRFQDTEDVSHRVIATKISTFTVVDDTYPLSLHNRVD